MIISFPLQGVSENRFLCYLQHESCSHINNETCCLNWTEHTNNLVSSFTELHISVGIYHLKENLTITGIQSFYIVGNNTTLLCQNGYLVIENSSFIYIENVNFINCGYTYKHIDRPKSLLNISAAVFVHKVSSVYFTNVVFQDSCGYGIIALDVVSDSLLQNVSVFQTNMNAEACQNRSVVNGGIFWAYNERSVSIPVSFTITNYTVYNISNGDSLSFSNSTPSAIGIILHQQECNISIAGVTIQNIRSIRTPLVSVSTASFDGTIVNISNSRFNNNTVSSVFTMVNDGIASVSVSMDNNTFCNNIVYGHLISLTNVALQLQEHTLFESNMANTLIQLSKYVLLQETAKLFFLNNHPHPTLPKFKRFIIEKTPNELNECLFQFTVIPSALSTHIEFCNNKGFYREVYIHSFLYNCTWASSNISTKHVVPEILYKYTLRRCGNEIRTIKFGWENHVFPCDGSSDHLLYSSPTPYYFPGQTVTIKLQYSRSLLLLYTDFVSNPFHYIAPICKISHYHSNKPKLYSVSKWCTELSYIVESNASKKNTCLILLRENQDLTYVLNVPLKNSCPPGFSLDSDTDVCTCSNTLQRSMKGITCNISNETVKPPRHNWISVTSGNEVIYTTHCEFDYCIYYPHYISLHKPDDQCIPTRSGISCGHCKRGLSAIFGSVKCKKCSNYGLLLVLLFAVVGIVLVISIFMLDLTVAKGDIYGFIFFVNVLSVNSSEEFAMRSVIVSLSNLDLGVEVCFYNGMTAYAATWFQFMFPAYVLMITAGLVYASRHFPIVEKLTRRKVIPVMATLFLLSYNKIMVVTFNGLFAYTTIYYLNRESKKVYWAIDTDISLFGAKHLLLFTFCALLFLFVIIPVNALLLFTKKFYRFKIVVKCLKPYLDACQAPFKDNYQYFLGVEFLLRAAVYTVDHIFIQDDAAIYIVIFVIQIVYMCWFQPFKSNLKTLIYLLYLTYLIILCVLFLHFSVLTVKPRKPFIVSFRIILCLAFAQFVLIVVYHIWKFVLCRCHCFTKHLNTRSHRFLTSNYFMGNHSLELNKEISPVTIESSPDSVKYDEFREELLTYDQ